MSKFNHISIGNVIRTEDGYLSITDGDSSGVICDEYRLNDDGEAVLSMTGRSLTLEEVAHIMKQVDFVNHTVIFD